MQLATAFETAPDNDDLPSTITHWGADTIADRKKHGHDAEAFVHKRTATAARIVESDDGTYSVQTSTGDYAGGDCVIQPDDPAEFVSGLSSVVAMEIETLSEARAIAYYWIRGFSHANAFKGTSFVDATETGGYEAIQ